MKKKWLYSFNLYNMNVAKRLTVIFLLCVLTLSLSAQSVTRQLASYVKNINQFTLLNPQEKVYLHFDNTGYYLGETIWFKAYVVGASKHQATALSKVLHVELMTPQGAVIDSRKLKIEDGQCHGEFRLENNKYRSGFYEVRAYTRSMLNFGEDCIFSRVLPVYSNPEMAGDYAEKKMDAASVLINLRKKSENTERINLSFYPEGGSAVIGLPSRIAFKATGREGQDISIRGTVYNALGKPVATLATTHQGMGVFELTPEAREYKVVVESEGRKRDFSFARIKPLGYVMQVDSPDDKTILLQLQKSSALPDDTVGISVSCRGLVYSLGTVRLGAKPYKLRLSKTQLPVGCLQFTLFDRQGNILSERLAFNTGQVEYLTVESKLEKSFHKPLEQVKMEFSVKDKMGSPISTTFSLAVRDAGTELHTGYQNNVLTDLLLSSDVKGYIENPMQYFITSDSTIQSKLDLLMLVQGWRRYNWQVMAGIVPFDVKYYAEEGLSISGKVLGWSKDKEEAGVNIMYWMLKDSASFHDKGTTDENGRFHFLLPDSPNIVGNRSLGLQVSVKGKRKHCRILLDRSGPQGKDYSFYDVLVKDTLVIFEEQTDSLKKGSVTDIQYLDEVVVKKDRLKPDILLDVERDINALIDKGMPYPSTIGEYLESRVAAISGPPEYKYGNQKTYFCYNYKKPETPDRMKRKMESISSWRIEELYGIKVYYRNKFAWNQVIKSGNCLLRAPLEPRVFILVYVYEDGLHDEYQAGIRQTFYQGYSQSREFYHMDNSKKFPGEVDFRRTLYWNPNVKTDEEGKAKISFYNNSSCKQMSVSAEGITGKGVFIIGEHNIKKKE